MRRQDKRRRWRTWSQTERTSFILFPVWHTCLISVFPVIWFKHVKRKTSTSGTLTNSHWWIQTERKCREQWWCLRSFLAKALFSFNLNENIPSGKYNEGALLWPIRAWPWSTMFTVWVQPGTFVACHSPSVSPFTSHHFGNKGHYTKGYLTLNQQEQTSCSGTWDWRSSQVQVAPSNQNQTWDQSWAKSKLYSVYSDQCGFFFQVCVMIYLSPKWIQSVIVSDQMMCHHHHHHRRKTYFLSHFHVFWWWLLINSWNIMLLPVLMICLFELTALWLFLEKEN